MVAVFDRTYVRDRTPVGARTERVWLPVALITYYLALTT